MIKKLLISIFIVAVLCGCGNSNIDNTVIQDESVLTFAEQSEESTAPIPNPPLETESPKAVESPIPVPIPSPTPIPMPTVPADPPAAQTAAPPEPIEPEVASDTVKISITGYENHEILPLTEQEFEEGKTVFDILLHVTKERNIPMIHSGNKRTAYIKGIDNLFEFDKGGLSGWIYLVNGVFPQKSCGAYVLNKNDIIEFKYTTKPGEFTQ